MKSVFELPILIPLRPDRPEQEEHRVSDDRRDRPRQLWLRHPGGRRHARGVRLGDVLQTHSHPVRDAAGGPQPALRVSIKAHFLTNFSGFHGNSKRLRFS